MYQVTLAAVQYHPLMSGETSLWCCGSMPDLLSPFICFAGPDDSSRQWIPGADHSSTVSLTLGKRSTAGHKTASDLPFLDAGRQTDTQVSRFLRFSSTLLRIPHRSSPWTPPSPPSHSMTSSSTRRPTRRRRTRGKRGTSHTYLTHSSSANTRLQSYALNFTNVPYRTTWVPLNAVAATRDSLELPANRTHQNGSAFPTLPIIRDPLASGKEVAVGDSFEIALHLQNAYLSDPEKQLFPSAGNGTVALHRVFNAFVDQLFSQHGAPLAGCYMPLDPRTAEADKAAFLQRFPGKMKWEDFEIARGSEARKTMLGDFEAALSDKLAPCFPEGGGPFMDGRESPMYADFIVGGWLQFMRGCLPEWEELRGRWSGGKWGRLFDALEEWANVDGRDGVVPARR